MDMTTVVLWLFMGAVLLGFAGYVLSSKSGSKKTKRIKSVLSQHRSDLGKQFAEISANKQSTLRIGRQKGGMAETLQKLLAIMNMDNLLQSKALKQDLSKAGIRGRNAIVFYISARMLTAVGGIFVAILLVGLWRKFPYPEFVRYIMYAIGAYVGFYAPKIFLINTIQTRQAQMTSIFPDVLDLMVICVEAGLGIEQAFSRVTEEIIESSPVLAQELGLTSAELAYLGDRRVAYENFATRTGLPAAKSLATTLIQSEQYGTPVGVALKVLAQDKRDERMGKAERKAAALPAQLTVPMIIFFLPVLFLVVIGPAYLQINM
ncbi:MAG: type II secretion system F family protein [Rhodospirillaceae bacterium]|nr:type II secretion system F family protein [Rhodospirillaceae bacterium]